MMVKTIIIVLGFLKRGQAVVSSRWPKKIHHLDNINCQWIAGQRLRLHGLHQSVSGFFLAHQYYYYYESAYSVLFRKLRVEGGVAFTFTNEKYKANLVGNMEGNVVIGMVGGSGNYTNATV